MQSGALFSSSHTTIIPVVSQIRRKEVARSSKWLKMLDKWKDHVGTEKLRQRIYKGMVFADVDVVNNVIQHFSARYSKPGSRKGLVSPNGSSSGPKGTAWYESCSQILLPPDFNVCLILSLSSGRYQKMLEWGLEHSTDVRQIDLDVNRTFRNNVMFRDRYSVKQRELFHILVAYSVYNSVIVFRLM